MKDLQVKESKKPQKPKAPVPQHSENAETFKKAWKEKKNDCPYRRGHWAPKNGRLQENSTLASGVNNTSTVEGGNSRKNQNRSAR